MRICGDANGWMGVRRKEIRVRSERERGVSKAGQDGERDGMGNLRGGENGSAGGKKDGCNGGGSVSPIS
jgi:hypothetical protein